MRGPVASILKLVGMSRGWWSWFVDLVRCGAGGVSGRAGVAVAGVWWWVISGTTGKRHRGWPGHARRKPRSPRVRPLSRGGRSIDAQPSSGVSRFGRARSPTRSRVRSGHRGRQVGVDLAGDVALQDAGDLTHRLALVGASGDIVLGALVVGHAGEHDPVERRVGLPVAAAVEAVSLDFA